MSLKSREHLQKLLNQAQFSVAAVEPAQWPAAPGSEVAFAGRSNAGKSSAINALARRRALARTSKTPGRTRQIVFFELGAGYRLVDLPGYGYARVPEDLRRSWAGMIEHYLSAREGLKGVILVMDARHPLTELDRHMLGWCRPRALAVHVLLTKIDKLSRAGAARAEAAVRRFVSDLPNPVTVQQFSAVKHVGVDKARERVLDWLSDDLADRPRAW